MRFNKTKCKVLHLGWGNPQSSLEDEQMESSPAKEDLVVLGDDRLDMSWHCAFAAQKAKHALGCSTSSMSNSVREMILSCYSTHEIPPRVLHPSLGSPAQEGHRPLGVSSEEATKTIRGMEHLSHKEGMRELGLCSLEKRKLQSDVIAAFQSLKGTYREDGARPFRSDRTRGNGFKLKAIRFRLDIQKIFCTAKVVRH
ncbi:hypothetical protein WISP_147679 [Willisornis vidua]|uniref:Uncharacterized protein n=1 Tax=Willisornis vidua TaxID=1566151 RepID=A0ABQ9CLC2_9PASS|nr:hypothetical protein WISP_147679 [Willisornis vidua]